MPAADEGECLKIMRIEDGTLGELVSGFLDLVAGLLFLMGWGFGQGVPIA